MIFLLKISTFYETERIRQIDTEYGTDCFASIPTFVLSYREIPGAVHNLLPLLSTFPRGTRDRGRFNRSWWNGIVVEGAVDKSVDRL